MPGAPVGGKLGELFVEFAAKGHEDAKAAIQALGYELQKDEAGVVSLAKAFAAALGDVKARTVPAVTEVGAVGLALAKVGDLAKAAADKIGGLAGLAGYAGSALAGGFKYATAGALTLATATMAGSVEGRRMAFLWTQLGRELAGIVLPVFEAVTAAVMKVTGWLRSLSGEQQSAILKWGGLAAGVAMFASGIGTVPGLIIAAVSAFQIFKDMAGDSFDGLADQFKEVGRSMLRVAAELKPVWEAVCNAIRDNLQGVAVILKLVVGQIEAMVGTVERVWRAMDNLPEWAKKAIKFAAGPAAWFLDINGSGGAVGAATDPKKHRTPTMAGGGFEGIGASYGRIQAAIARTDPIERQIKEQQKTNSWLEELVDRFRTLGGRLVPAN